MADAVANKTNEKKREKLKLWILDETSLISELLHFAVNELSFILNLECIIPPRVRVY
jgi:hypothetical protein